MSTLDNFKICRCQLPEALRTGSWVSSCLNSTPSCPERARLTFLEMGDAPLSHNVDPLGNIGALPLHSGIVEVLGMTGTRLGSAPVHRWNGTPQPEPPKSSDSNSAGRMCRLSPRRQKNRQSYKGKAVWPDEVMETVDEAKWERQIILCYLWGRAGCFNHLCEMGGYKY